MMTNQTDAELLRDAQAELEKETDSVARKVWRLLIGALVLDGILRGKER